MVNPKELAERYFETVRSRDIDRFVALYTEDASFVYPDGREAKGAAAIRERQAVVFAAKPPSPSPQSMIAGERCVAVELAAKLPDGAVRRMANFFYFNADGLIERQRVYRQG